MRILTDMLPILLKVIKMGALIYLGYCAMLFLMQRKMMYPRHMIPVPPGRENAIPGLEKNWIKTEFGKVEAWYLPPAEGSVQPAPAVIFAHGNGDLIDFLPD